MRSGLIISLMMHVALLAWALFTIRTTPELAIPSETPIEVALIDPSEVLRLKKGALDVTELEAKAKDAPKPDQSVKEAEKPKEIVAEEMPAAPPPPPEPEKQDPIAEKLAAATPPPAPEPPPGPTPEEKKLLEEKLEQDRIAEEKKKAEEAKKKAAEEKKKAEERKKRIEEQRKKLAEQKRKKDEEKKKSEADRIAALLDKDPTKKGAPNAANDPTKPTDYTGRTAGANTGEDTVLSAREQDLLVSQIRAQLRDCWRLPGGGGGIETTVVVLSWRLRSDGSLDGEPEVRNRQSDSVYQIAAEAAIRAVKTCSPFDLPSDKYDAWKFIDEWRFDPREML